jgi:hypothetical protein
MRIDTSIQVESRQGRADEKNELCPTL